MKNLLKIILVNLIIFSMTVFTVTSITLNEKCGISMPTLPHSFKGYAKYGSSVLASKTVTATLDGVDFSDTTDSNGWYEVDVSRCGNSTATAITFTVCTRVASETGNFSIGGENLNFNLTISSDCPTTAAADTGGGGGGGGGAGGGGGGGAAMPSEVDLNKKADFTTTGTTLKQTQGDTAKFTIAGTQYTAELTKLKSDSVTITVAGQSTVLKIGDSAEFDVNGDGVKDISITLKGIEGGRAEILYKLLAKAPEKPAVEEEKPPEVKPPEEVKPPAEVIPPPSKAWIGWLVVGAIIVVGLVVYFVVKKKKPVE